MTTLVRWDPFREMSALHDELSRLMNGLYEVPGRPTQSWVPTLDAWETDDEFVYAFDLPGVPQDRVTVEAEDGTLTVTAELLASKLRVSLPSPPARVSLPPPPPITSSPLEPLIESAALPPITPSKFETVSVPRPV